MPVTFHPGLNHPQFHGGRGYAATVALVSDQTLDCDVLELVCFGPDGATFTVSRPPSEAARLAAGAPVDVDHWAFVDMS